MAVPSNITEGYGRKTTADYIRSLYIGYGSNCELETQVLLSEDLGYVEAGKLTELIDNGKGQFECRRGLEKYFGYLRSYRR